MRRASTGPESWAPAGMGVISLVISLAVIASFTVLFSVAALRVRSGRSLELGDPMVREALGSWAWGTGALCLAGIALGIAGLMQHRRRRGVAAAGVVLNTALPVGLLFFVVVAAVLDYSVASRRHGWAAPLPDMPGITLPLPDDDDAPVAGDGVVM